MQNAPGAEKYSSDAAKDFKTIKHPKIHQQQQRTNLRRKVPENSSLMKRIIRSKRNLSSQPQYTAGVKRNAKVLISENKYEESNVRVNNRNSNLKAQNIDSESGQSFLKRRTRSDDHGKSQDENEPLNQKVEFNSRHRWPSLESTISKTS